jgi:hypothetical protein
MPAKKSKPKVTLESRRKKSANSTSFQPGNMKGFKPGESGNVGGKPKAHRLLSRTLRALLSDPAPREVAAAFGLGRNASWAMCIAARLVRQAVRGDLDAARLVGALTEGAHPRVGLDPLSLDDVDVTTPPLIAITFVESEEGRPKEPVIIDAALPSDVAD